MKEKLIILIVLSVFLFACSQTISPQEIDTLNFEENIHPVQLPGNQHNDDELLDIVSLPVRTLQDGTLYVVHPDKLSGGGPPQDGIPSIDEPSFVSVTDADAWMDDEDIVLFLHYNGVKKAYPKKIMTWHEIVNDYAQDIPIVITYCPLCITGIAYQRTINDEVVELGTSGKLFNSNLVMYDRYSGTYWTQVDGVGIVGELSGQTLNQIPLDIVYWKDIKESHPTTQILNIDTGFDRNYGRDPYITYYTDDDVWFPLEFRDFSVNTKEIVYGIELNGEYKAYRETDIMEGVIKDVVGGIAIEIKREQGVVNTSVKETGEEIIEERHFWFSWYAFHPDTSLYEVNS